MEEKCQLLAPVNTVSVNSRCKIVKKAKPVHILSMIIAFVLLFPIVEHFRNYSITFPGSRNFKFKYGPSALTQSNDLQSVKIDPMISTDFANLAKPNGGHDEIVSSNLIPETVEENSLSKKQQETQKQQTTNNEQEVPLIDHQQTTNNEQQQKNQTYTYMPSKKTQTFTCPKVYVYENLLFTDFNDLGPAQTKKLTKNNQTEKSLEMVFGQLLKKNAFLPIRKTGSTATEKIFLYRLLHSKKCRTLNPNEADLFYVPTYPKPKVERFWNKINRKFRQYNKLKQGELDLLKHLPHLNATNAKKHFMITAKYHSNNQSPGWYKPQNKLLRQFMRAAHTFPLGIEKRGCQKYHSRKDCVNPSKSVNVPNITIIPYPTNIVWTNTTRPAYFIDRPYKVAYITKLTGPAHGDVKVRRKLRSFCNNKRINKSFTGVNKTNIGPNNINLSTEMAPLDAFKYNNVPSSFSCVHIFKTLRNYDLYIKARSVFCLEPGGDTPSRKSIMDDYSAGCIPVFIGDIVPKYFYDYYWEGWHGDMKSHILIPRDKFIAGKISIIKYLNSIPDEKIREMQHNIWQNGHKFSYAAEDINNDAVITTLNKLYDISNKDWHVYRRRSVNEK